MNTSLKKTTKNIGAVEQILKAWLIKNSMQIQFYYLIKISKRKYLVNEIAHAIDAFIHPLSYSFNYIMIRCSWAIHA